MPRPEQEEVIGYVCDQTLQEGLVFEQFADGEIGTALVEGPKRWPVNPRYVGLYIDDDSLAHPYVGIEHVKKFHRDNGVDEASLHTDILEYGFLQLERWLPKQFLVISKSVEGVQTKGLNIHTLPRVRQIARNAMNGQVRSPRRMLDYPAPLELTSGGKRRIDYFFEAVLSKPTSDNYRFPYDRRYWPPV